MASEHEEALSGLGVPCVHGRQATNPRGAFVAWLDDVRSTCGDGVVATRRHAVTAFLVTRSSRETDELCEALEGALDERAWEWERADRQWFDDEQSYQTTYSFEYAEKLRIG